MSVEGSEPTSLVPFRMTFLWRAVERDGSRVSPARAGHLAFFAVVRRGSCFGTKTTSRAVREATGLFCQIEPG